VVQKAVELPDPFKMIQ